MEHSLQAPGASTQAEIERMLALCPVFAHWPEDRLRQLADASRLRHYARRTPLDLRSGRQREVFAVVSGSIEVVTSNAAGDKYVLAVLGVGQVAGLLRLLDDVGDTQYSCHVRQDSRIIHAPGALMRRILDEEPILWRDIAELTLRRYLGTMKILQGQAIGSSRRRVAIMLVQLAKRHEEHDHGAHSMALNVSQSDLAHMIGVTRQTISKELARFKDEGLLGDSEGYRLIRLTDIPGLQRVTRED